MRRLYNATRYSLMGLAATWRQEPAFRQELMMFLILAPVGYWLGDDRVERALLIGVLFPVLIAELLNSALEAIVDRIGLERHPLSKQAKDAGSAAVFIALAAVPVIWALVLI